MRRLAEIYLENRFQFYSTLLPRIPNPEIRLWLETAVTPWMPDSRTKQNVAVCSSEVSTDEFASALALMDILKKTTYGAVAARTVISVSEALKRSREVEEAGVLLFDTLRQESGGAVALLDEGNRRRKALSALVRLEDSLRYHRLKIAFE